MLNRSGRFLRIYWLETIMVLPLILYIGLLTLAPVLQAIGLSFTDRYSGAFPTLSNYEYIVSRPDFGDAFVNTIGITLIGVTLEMTVGLILALMLAREFRGRGLFRTIILTPMGVPTLVAGAAMLYFFRTNGYVNELLLRLGLIDVPVYWTESGPRGMLAVAFADMWKVTPIVVLLLLAGLESIPGDVYEAADVDGASTWQTFRSVTLPLLLRIGLIDVPIYWTESGPRGMLAVAFADMWKVTPIVVLLLLAGLESIPGDIYEAADVDGASPWQAFRSVTLPLLMPAITMALILRAIDAFRIFDVVMVMASRSIPVMSTFVYINYFDFQDQHSAAAAATILLLMIVVFIAAYFLLVERRRGELA